MIKNSTNNNDVNNDVINNDLLHQMPPNEVRSRLLNEKNIPITEDFVNSIFQRVGFNHKVINLHNFQLAMIHESYLESNLTDSKVIKLIRENNIQPLDEKTQKKCIPLQKLSYDRLEFLGDSIIRHALSKYLYARFESANECFLTQNRSKIENKFALSDLAKKFGLQNYIVIDKHIELMNGRISYISITEDAFEAFVGALNLEIDDIRTVEFMWLLIEKELDIAETIRTQNNYKDKLMQHFHKIDIVKHDLQYKDEEFDSLEGYRKFKTIVYDKNINKALGVGSGRSKKSSQQRAAKDALIKLGLLGNDDENDDEYRIDGNIDEEINKSRNVTKQLNEEKNIVANVNKKILKNKIKN